MSQFQKSTMGLFFVSMIFFTCPYMSLGEELTVQIKTTPDQAKLPFEIEFDAIIPGTQPYPHTWNFGNGISELQKDRHYYRETSQIVPDTFVPENTVFRTYTDTSAITRIVQDSRDSSILWVGTSGGLIRLNTLTGDKKFFVNNLPGIRVNTLIQASDGALWMGTGIGWYSNNDGGLARFDYDRNQWTLYNSSNSDLPDDHVYSLVQSSDGAIWIGTYSGGLARFDYDRNQWTVYDTSNSDLPSDVIYSLIQSSDGAIWIGAEFGGLTRFDYDRNQWTVYNTSNSGLPYNSSFGSLLQSSDGAIWISTLNGLARFDYDRNQWTSLHYSSVESLFQSSDGAVWMGTKKYGLTRQLDNDRNQYNTSNSGLPDNHVTCILESPDGAIWVGTESGGLARFDYDRNQWTVYDTSNGLPYNWTKALIQSSDMAIWVGTLDGLARFDYDRNQWTVYKTSDSDLPSDSVWSLLQSSDGAIWVGTESGGLARFDYDRNQWTIYNNSNSDLPDNRVWSLLQSSDGAIWMGISHWNSGNYRLARFDYDKNQWTVYNSFNSSLPNDDVRSLVQSSDGAIWVGTDGGLVRFDYDRNQWTVYNTSNSSLPASYWLGSLFQSSDSAIWVGTQGGGLVRFDYDRNQWTVYNTSNSSLPFDLVNSILQSPDGAIWVGTGRGSARFDYNRNQWTVYNASNNNLPGNRVESLLQPSDRVMWMGTNGGISRITLPVSLESPGRFILVAGRDARENTLWPVTSELTASAYRIFNLIGFRNTDIYLMSQEKWVDFNGDGSDDHVVDCPPQNEDRTLTAEDLRYAITGWAVKNYTSETPLYIYLIGHGYPSDGEHSPYFMVAPDELLYTDDLNDMLNTYENATGGKVILINESCYSGQFLEPLKKQGRIIITSTADKVVNYDNWGANSFTHYFLQKIFENNNIYQAFANAEQRLRKSSLTYTQTPQLDDNGDGKYDTTDGVSASEINIGGDFAMGAMWPEIISVTKSNLTGTSISFTATTNVHMKRVWATIHPPNYAPDTSGDYQKIDLEKFYLHDHDDNLTYEGNHEKFCQTGTYIITVYAKDQFGNTAVSEPLEIVAKASPGDVNCDSAVNLADAVMSLKISAASDVSDQDINPDADIDNNRIGLEEAVYILQVVGGLREPVNQ